MSFSRSVKEELLKKDVRARHCRIAELTAVYAFCGQKVPEDGEEALLRIRTDLPGLKVRVFTLLRKTIKMDACVIAGKSDEASDAGSGNRILITGPAEAKRVSELLSFRDSEDLTSRICSRSCCARAFLRGAFLCAGSVSDPEKSYHFEIVCPNGEIAEMVSAMIRRFEIDARTTVRKGRHVVYVKEGTQIVDLLNVMGAHSSLMQMENVRIVKDVRNRINRQVNCETANLTKTVNASVREAEEIRFLEEAGILKTMAAPLRETAELRLAYPDASLRELGELHDPPIGRSGVNHRLKKISEAASRAADAASSVVNMEETANYDQKRDYCEHSGRTGGPSDCKPGTGDERLSFKDLF